MQQAKLETLDLAEDFDLHRKIKPKIVKQVHNQSSKP